MLVFDQLKKDDAQLRFLAAVVLAGMLILLTGLWWVQIVSTRYYRDKLEIQSTRTVRMPAIRGKILDRNGSPLAENRPSYSIDLYLEELSHPFQSAFSRALARINADLNHQRDAREKQLGRKLTAAERKQFALPESTRNLLAIAILLDLISQFLIFHEIRPGAALVIGPVLIAVPYVLSRAFSNRIWHWRNRHKPTPHVS
jgi:penicillin-binding protein 2